jgi:hypothetical protein
MAVASFRPDIAQTHGCGGTDMAFVGMGVRYRSDALAGKYCEDQH